MTQGYLLFLPFNFFKITIFVTLACSLLHSLGFWWVFLSFTSIKKQSSGSCLLCLFYFITRPALITIESRWWGRTNSSCLLGFHDFVSSVLLPLDPGMFEQPGKERWVPLAQQVYFSSTSRTLAADAAGWLPAHSACHAGWGDWEAPVDWHFQVCISEVNFSIRSHFLPHSTFLALLQGGCCGSSHCCISVRQCRQLAESHRENVFFLQGFS